MCILGKSDLTIVFLVCFYVRVCVCTSMLYTPMCPLNECVTCNGVFFIMCYLYPCLLFTNVLPVLVCAPKIRRASFALVCLY